MKKILFFFTILFTTLISAQVPQGISYQAIALNTSGNPVISSNIGLRLSVLDNTASGTVLYSETHTKTTNAQGLFNTVIGQGTPITGTFSSIDWGTNSKFLKVELDAAGGSNFTLIGTTQLLSVPYALTTSTIKTAAGQGITLTSPNGTAYTLSVNDSGQLSLPTSNSTQNYPNQLYLIGSYNGFNHVAGQQFFIENSSQYGGYKYLTAGSQLKFVSDTSGMGQVYGVDGSLNLVINGSTYNVPSTGFYFIKLSRYSINHPFDLSLSSISPTIETDNYTSINPAYNSSTNTFSFIVNGVTNSSTNNKFKFKISSFNGSDSFGDNLSDGSIDPAGTDITFSNLTSTPKNFRVDLVLNFNGSGTYTITEI